MRVCARSFGGCVAATNRKGVAEPKRGVPVPIAFEDLNDMSFHDIYPPVPEYQVGWLVDARFLGHIMPTLLSSSWPRIKEMTTGGVVEVLKSVLRMDFGLSQPYRYTQSQLSGLTRPDIKSLD